MNEVDEILAAQSELTSNDDSHPLTRDYLHKRRRALEQRGIFAEGYSESDAGSDAGSEGIPSSSSDADGPPLSPLDYLL